ncbi:hypothetical protein [Muricauda aquimarina]
MKHKVFTELQMDFIEETKCEYATAYNYIIEPSNRTPSSWVE